VNLSNVFLVQFPNFSLSYSLLFKRLQLLLVQSYISGSTFAVSLYINSCTLTSFPLPFAQHFCLQLLLLLLLLHTAIGLLPGDSGYFASIQNMKLVTTKFKLGGQYEKHVVATWNFGNHLSICF